MSVLRRRLMGASRKGSAIDMSNYMTIEALEDGLTAKLTRTACEYSIDGGEWVSLAANTSTPAINAGHIISFKANNPTANSSYGIGTFTINKKCNLKGNCMSMLAYDDAASMTTVKMRGFRTLFKNCTNVINVEKGFLPATKLDSYCYYQMFYGCSNLTTAPDLPSTSLQIYCYKEMFYGCSSLRTPPELPATSMANYCYGSMFEGCTRMYDPPVLPATTLAEFCYENMFRESGIRNFPELPATTLAYRCYVYMFNGCDIDRATSLDLPAKTPASHCYDGMFSNCYLRGNITLSVHLLTNESDEGISDTSDFFYRAICGSNVTFIGNSAYKGADASSIPALLREDFGIPGNVTVLVEDF